MTKLYTGIDHHKRYSIACTLDKQGNLIKESRIAGNAPETFATYYNWRFFTSISPSSIRMTDCTIGQGGHENRTRSRT